MKRILISTLVVALLVGAFALSGSQKGAVKNDLQIDIESRNPWTHLRLNNAPETFHFVVMSDRTGGNRGRVFSQAVEQINLLQPTFVVCVGDLIQGYSKDTAVLASQWKELQGFTSKLQMPFFYVPGNHDMANPVEADVWKQRFGRSYYHFVYKDVLFLAVNTDDPNEGKEKGQLSKDQIEYFQKVLKDNAGVRWTFVLVHKPIWTHANLDSNGWLDLEKALNGRKYTVFAGHVHRFQKFVRQGMNYYQLATTGGGSKLRGVHYGEFDQIAWVTVKTKTDPIIANLMLDGIYPESMKKVISDEPGLPILNRKAVHPVHGKVTIDGAPAVDAQIVFWRPDPKDAKKATRVTDALVEADGSYTVSTYVLNDGMEIGEYKVTVTLRKTDPSGKTGPNLLPERFATHEASELRATVKTGANDVNFELMSK
jgi:serine/threonine-protein phosphatase CPPED1